MAGLEFDAVINDKNFHSTVEKMKKDITSVSTTANAETNKIASSFSSLGKMAAGAFTLVAVKEFISQVTAVRSEIQQLEIAFTTMLGGKAKADALMAEIVDFAATTPFDLKQTATAAKQLLAYGFAADSVKDNLTTLGNVAAGVGSQIGELVYLYGTLKASGRVTQMDINQFAGRGIPIYAELAKVLKINVEQVRDFVSAGKVGFSDIEAAFKGMTSEGALFYNLMQEQSKSLGGQISNLGDAFDQMLNDIGKSSEGIIGGSISGVAYLVENYKQVGAVLAGIIGTYGAYKAAVIAVNTVEKVNLAIKARIIASNGVYNTSLVIQEALLGRMAAAQARLNASMLANPYVLLTTVIAGLAAAIWVLHDGTTAQEKAQKKVGEVLEKNAKLISDLKAETQELDAVLRSESESEFEKAKAFERLQQMYPKQLKNITLETYLRKEATQAAKDFNNSFAELSVAQNVSELEKAQEAVKEYEANLSLLYKTEGHAKKDNAAGIKKEVERLKNAIEQVKILKGKVEEARKTEWESNTPIAEKVKYYKNAIDSVQAQINKIKETAKETNKVGAGIKNWQNAIDNISLDSFEKQLRGLRGRLSALAKDQLAPKTKATFEADAEKAREDYEKLKPEELNTEKGKALKKAFEEANAMVELYSLTNKKVAKETKTTKDEIFPAGSVAEYTRQINLAQQALERLNPNTNADRTQKLKDQITKLTEERAKAEKAISVKTFQEEIEAKKAEYEKYELWAMNLNKEIADAQFKDLLKSGGSFSEFLYRKLAPLDNKVMDGDGTAEEGQQVAFLVKLIDEAKEAKSEVEKFNEELDKLKMKSGSITEYIMKLQTEKDAIMSDPSLTRDNKSKKVRIIEERVMESEGNRKELLADFLIQVNVAEARRLAITKQYADLRFEVEKSEAENKIELIKEINRQERLALEQNLNDKIRNSDAYLKLDKEIQGTEREQLVNHLKDLQDARDEALKLAGGDTDNQEYIRLANDVKKQTEAIANFDTSKWREWGNVVGEVGDVFSGMEGTLGNIGMLLSGLADASQKMYVNFEKSGEALSSTEKADSIASGVDGVISLISLIAKSGAKRREKRQQEEDSGKKAVEDYNLALVEQIRLQSILNESPYVKDYSGRITDAMSAMQKATSGALETLNELIETGKAKNGTVNKTDWDAVGKAAGAGAAAGATAGTILGGWAFGVGTLVGTGIGLITGAITGLLAAFKTDARYSGLFEIYPDLISGNGELNEELAKTLIANDQLDDATKRNLETLIKYNEEWVKAKEQIQEIVSELSGQLGSDLRNALVGAFESGTSAAEAFSNSVSKTLNNMLSNLIFSTVFKNVFKDLEENLGNSLAIFGKSGGTDLSGVFDSFAAFSKDAKDAQELFLKLLEAAKQRGAEFDLDLFNPAGKSGSNSMTGAIKGVSEETASIFVGQINAIRINQANNTIIMNSQLTKLTIVADNSLYLPYLLSIDKRLASISGDQWRAVGITQ